MIQIIGTIFVAALGLAFGSFLNVCLSRWPAEESVVQPRSHCRHCSHTLSWWENVPLVSWLVLQGRCRECRSWIGWRYPLVELAVAVLWVAAAGHLFRGLIDPDLPPIYLYHALAIAIGKMIFYWLLVALALLDAENFWLPNFLTIPGAVLGLVFALLVAGIGSLIPNDVYLHTPGYAILMATILRLLSILIAAGIILLIRWIYWLVRRQEGMGLGDAKLMALLAAWLGLPQALFAFGVGVMIGGGAALVLLALPKVQSDAGGWALKKLPLGTFLCIGGVVSSLWGQRCIDAYLRWAGF
jgi:leader peptidase (prepilin peptidase)/N-methyltransferase